MDGVLLTIREGAVVPVGTVLVVIGGDGAPAPEPPKQASAPRERGGQVRATVIPESFRGCRRW